MSFDALYQLEIAQKWSLITDISSIMVIPLTIARLIELYKNTGAPVFFRIIVRLTAMENVNILSPDLKFYLAMDIKFSELPLHYKMERALMAQESTRFE